MILIQNLAILALLTVLAVTLATAAMEVTGTCLQQTTRRTRRSSRH